MDLHRARNLRADQTIEGREQIVNFIRSRADAMQLTAQRVASGRNGAIGSRPRVDAFQLDAQAEAIAGRREHRIGADEARDPGIAPASVATGERKLRDHAISGAELQEGQLADVGQRRVEDYFVSFHFDSPCV